MRNLHDATERICELKGDLIAQDVLITTLLLALQPDTSKRFKQQFERASEAARTVLVNAPISDVTLQAFERGVQRSLALVGVLNTESARARPALERPASQEAA